MRVIQETDAVQSKKGFSANFELIKNEPSGCISDHVQQADTPGHFMTTGFPMKYPINTECSWFIYSEASLPILVSFSWIFLIKTFQLQFSTFDLEETSWDGECNFDYVAVYEGRHEIDENLINKVCGTLPINKKQMISLKHNFIAETGEMFVKFFSDNTVSFKHRN